MESFEELKHRLLLNDVEKNRVNLNKYCTFTQTQEAC